MLASLCIHSIGQHSVDLPRLHHRVFTPCNRHSVDFPRWHHHAFIFCSQHSIDLQCWHHRVFIHEVNIVSSYHACITMHSHFVVNIVLTYHDGITVHSLTRSTYCRLTVLISPYIHQFLSTYTKLSSLRIQSL